MFYVLLDGEKVELSRAPPTSLSEVRTMLEGALSTRGRVLAALTIDGQPFDESLGDRAPDGLRIEAASLSLSDALQQVGAALVPDVRDLQAKALDLAHAVLRAPWTDLQPQCLQLVETAAGVLQRAVEVASLRGAESALERAVTALAATVEAWMKGIEQRDAAEIALRLEGNVVPALDQLAAVLEAPASS